MEDLRTYEFPADTESLKEVYETGVSPEHLESPFRAIMSEIVSRARSRPLSVYLCSTDEDADVRNYFGFVLTRLIRKHLSTALLVDCDFLSVGLSGIVPHRDALGFLDLLLYGTSLGVIRQETKSGARVVGAGSFPVTKKSPFAMDAFGNARRYLVNQAKCVVFCGPALDDDEFIHPISEHVDLVILVRVGSQFDERFLDAFEEKICSVENSEAWSVRINTRLPLPEKVESAEKVEFPEGVEPTEKAEPTLVAEVQELVESAGEAEISEAPDGPGTPPSKRSPPEKTVSVEETAAFAPRTDVETFPDTEVDDGGVSAPRLGRRGGGSRLLRVITSVVGVVVIVFVVWWLYLTRSVREREQNLTDQVAVVDEQSPTAGDAVDSLREESTETASQVSPAGSTHVVAGGPGEPAAPSTGVEAGGEPKTTDRKGVVVTDKLDNFANEYLVHVSSFRRLDNAKDEAFYLLGWGYPVFIYRVDLGSKGMWYRVYVGPSGTREEATKHKIRLDDNPRILSTRIAKVPG